MVALNIITWRRALPNWPIVVINDTNISDFVPDMPEEFWRMPYPQVKSDLLRAGVLYHHGGLYLDTDFALSPLVAGAIKRLQDGYEVITYGNGPPPQGECNFGNIAGFSSNFM